MKKYEEHPKCKYDGSLLPVPSNAKLNAYLKEIADICGINKHLTFHILDKSSPACVYFIDESRFKTS